MTVKSDEPTQYEQNKQEEETVKQEMSSKTINEVFFSRASRQPTARIFDSNPRTERGLKFKRGIIQQEILKVTQKNNDNRHLSNEFFHPT